MAGADYIRGFDGVRAVAVVMVMVHHALWLVFPAAVDLGRLGVSLFFCLSGCLIVGILRAARARCEEGSSRVGLELKNFYVRRMLRLSPPYFLYVTVALVLTSLWPARFDYSGFAFHYTYTTNFWIGLVLKGWGNNFGHFWSLAVEEQYYLVAAPLILLVGLAKGAKVMGAFIVVGVLSCVALFVIGVPWITIYTFPTVNFVLISMGGLLAIFRPRLGVASLVTGVVLLAAATFDPWTEHIAQALMLPANGVAMLLLGLGCPLVIGFIFSKQKSAVVAALEMAPLRWIGKLSYGIYVYHAVIPFRSVGGTAIPALWGGSYNFALGYALGTVMNFGLTFLVAYLSWRFMEKPFLNLKTRFEAHRVPGGAGGMPAYAQQRQLP